MTLQVRKGSQIWVQSLTKTNLFKKNSDKEYESYIRIKIDKSLYNVVRIHPICPKGPGRINPYNHMKIKVFDKASKGS